MGGIDSTKNTSSYSFGIAYKLMLIVLFARLFLPLILSSQGVTAEVGFEGYLRVFSLGVLSIFLLHHLSRFSFVYAYERPLMLVILFFALLVIAQFFLLDNKGFNIQGSIKYFFYFIFIAVSLFSAIVHAEKTVDIILNIFIVLFGAVLIFYPYLIVDSGMNPISALLYNEHRTHFLLQASNEDAHFLTTLFLLVMVRLRNHRTWVLMLSGLFYLALIYNGTRSAFLIAILLPILYFVLYKRRFILSSLIIALLFIGSFSYVADYMKVKFEKDLEVFENPNAVLSGEKVGGSFSFRIAYLWLPMINYTSRESPVIGNGSNGWDIVAVNLLNSKKVESPHNTFVWAYVNWGIIGVIGLLMLFGIPFFNMVRIYIANVGQAYQPLVVALICTWIEFFVWSMIANAYTVHGWVILSFLIVLSVAVKYAVYKTFENEKEPQSFNYKYA